MAGGYFRFYWTHTYIHAELIVLMHGLCLAWERGYKKIICHSDSMDSVIDDQKFPLFHRYAAIMHNITMLLAADWEVLVEHTLHEGNVCAD